MKELNNYILEKLKINKNSKISFSFKKVTEKIGYILDLDDFKSSSYEYKQIYNWAKLNDIDDISIYIKDEDKFNELTDYQGMDDNKINEIHDLFIFDKNCLKDINYIKDNSNKKYKKIWNYIRYFFIYISK